MAAVAEDEGWRVESIDYRGMEDPTKRVTRLTGWIRAQHSSPVLVGSSMGGHVAAAAACETGARGMFLLAPAFYVPGYEEWTPGCPDCSVTIWHGWQDDVVPCEGSIRYAREHGARLTLTEDNHRLEQSIGVICADFRDFLRAIGP